MKTKLYLYGSVLCAAVLMSVSGKIQAQCNCPGGIPATEIVSQAEYMYPTTASDFSLFFPKMDPSIGTLYCVKLSATLQGKSTGYGKITANKGIFRWSTTVTPTITLPTANLSKTYFASFGPDTLATKHWQDSVNATATIPDSLSYDSSVTHGPIDLFINESFVVKGNASAAYIGDPATKVEVKFSTFGVFFPTMGTTNYETKISTTTSGSFYMYYYWCPNAVLAKNIRNFTTRLDESKDNVKVQWTADNSPNGTVYEVQVSSDGINFKTVYTQPSGSAGNNSNVYQFNYNIQSGSGENVYIRVKQTDANGKITYTSMNRLNIHDLKLGNTLNIYPNPAVNNKVSLQFPEEMNGDFDVDVVTLTGQKLFNRSVHITNSKMAAIELNKTTKSGVYYLRATDKRSGTVYTNKLFIK